MNLGGPWLTWTPSHAIHAGMKCQWIWVLEASSMLWSHASVDMSALWDMITPLEFLRYFCCTRLSLPECSSQVREVIWLVSFSHGSSLVAQFSGIPSPHCSGCQLGAAPMWHIGQGKVRFIVLRSSNAPRLDSLCSLFKQILVKKKRDSSAPFLGRNAKARYRTTTNKLIKVRYCRIAPN